MSDLPVMAITGTSKGIGRGIAEYFTKQGYRVAGCSRSPVDFELGNYFHTIVDVGDETQVRDWVRSIKRNLGQMDVLVCNAALAPAASLMLETSADVLEPLLQTNIAGTYYVCREAAKVMLLQRSGRIITVSSMAVGLHTTGTSAYSASKSAVVEMTKIMAKELAAFGITCNVMAPSVLMTEAVEALGEKVTARILESLTIKRALTIKEICNVISFFSAPESSCVTGQVLQLGLVS